MRFFPLVLVGVAVAQIRSSCKFTSSSSGLSYDLTNAPCFTTLWPVGSFSYKYTLCPCRPVGLSCAGDSPSGCQTGSPGGYQVSLGNSNTNYISEELPSVSQSTGAPNSGGVIVQSSGGTEGRSFTLVMQCNPAGNATRALSSVIERPFLHYTATVATSFACGVLA